MRKDRLSFSVLSNTPVQAFNNIGRINYFPDFQRIIEELG